MKPDFRDLAADSDILAIGCFGAICRDRVADELVAFSRIAPRVGFGIHEMPRAELLRALRARTLALVVLPGPVEHGFSSRSLWTDEVVVALPVGHGLAGAERVPPPALRREVMVVPRDQSAAELHRFLAARAFADTDPPTCTISGAADAAVLDLVARGRGVALFCASQADRSRRDVAIRPIASPDASFPVHAYWLDPPREPLATLLRVVDGQVAPG